MTARRALLARRDGARVVAGAYLLRTNTISPIIETALEILESTGFERLAALGATMTLLRYATGIALGRTGVAIRRNDRTRRWQTVARVAGPAGRCYAMAAYGRCVSARVHRNDPRPRDDLSLGRDADRAWACELCQDLADRARYSAAVVIRRAEALAPESSEGAKRLKGSLSRFAISRRHNVTALARQRSFHRLSAAQDDLRVWLDVLHLRRSARSATSSRRRTACSSVDRRTARSRCRRSPRLMLRLSTITLFAWSALRIGMP